MTKLPNLKKLGFPYPDDVIHLFVGGSRLHGASVGADDTDYFGVFVAPPHAVIGVDPYPHFVWSSGDNDSKNTAKDVDVCLYSLRKWAYLACKGNPSVLHFLFAQTLKDNWVWNYLLESRDCFLARSHLKAFLGFANQQRKRLLGQRTKDVSRPKLEKKFGYDTKYAMHIVRLFLEAKELMATGRITLPNPECNFLIEIRKGHYPLLTVLNEACRIEAEAIAAEKSSPLPRFVDRGKISKLIAVTHQLHWEVARWRRVG